MAGISSSTENSSPSCSSLSAKKKYFRWETDMIENLIDSLLQFKTNMVYKGLDFDGDKAYQYKEIRLAMAKIYEHDVTLFGPVISPTLPQDYESLSKEKKQEAKKMVKQSNELLTKGSKRVMEKVKEIRQNFAKAVVSGRRSGSGKIVYEHYDQLVTLWGGSPSSEPLSFGVSGDDFEDSNSDEINGTVDEVNSQEVENTDSEQDSSFEPEVAEREQLEGEPVAKKSKKVEAPASSVPKLIDNKRKHLEKNLSAAQRDQLLLKEAKEDAQFRMDLANAMRESTESFSNSIKDISKAMTDLGAGLCRSIEMLSRSVQPQPPINQNMFYQSPFGGPPPTPQPPQGFYSQMLNPAHSANDQMWES